MNSNTLTTRQLCLILAIFFPITKLLLVPSLLAGEAQNDLLLSAGILYLLQGAAVFALLWLMQRKKEDLFSLVKNRFGQGWARTCYLVLGIYFLFATLVPLLEQKSYVLDTMFDTRPTIVVFLPFFFYSVYAAAKGLTSTGRSADISVFFFVPAFLLLLIMAIGSTDFTALLPIGFNSPVAILKGSLSVIAHFAEAGYLLLFMGHVRIERKFLLKTTISYLVGMLAVLVFLALFYGIFSTVAVRELYSIAKIARYYNALKVIGRVDFILVYALEIVQLFTVVIPIQLCVHALCRAFNTQKSGIVSLFAHVPIFIFIYFSCDYAGIAGKIINYYFFPVFLLFSFLLPVLCSLFALPQKKKKQPTHV